jgi:copper chaperone
MLGPEGNRTQAALFGLAALVLTVAVFSTGCQRGATVSAQAAPPNRAAMRTVTVPVNGMICMVCAGRVKNALKAVHGVQDAEVNLEKRNATVQYENGRLNLDQLTRAINELGYKAGVPAAVEFR